MARLEAEWFSRPIAFAAAPRLPLSFQPPIEFTSQASTAPVRVWKGKKDTPPQLEGLQIPVTLNGPVREYIAFFQGRGRRIYAQWLSRMGRYRELMQTILERNHVPTELLYICMIESGFTTGALSHAGAVGLWQFMKRTGTEFGLRHDNWVDGRNDPEAATEAAAKLFADLYGRFGSWPLAMAAYNAGVGRVSRAITQYNTNDYWRLSAMGAITNEATHYVPKAMAAMIIGQDPERFGFGDVQPEAPIAFVKVQVPQSTRLDLLSKRLGLDANALAELNPEIRRGVTPPGGDYNLRIPPGLDNKLEAALGAARQKPGLYAEHRLRFGERLRDIAQSCDMSLFALRRLNEGLEGEGIPGQMLVIPHGCEPQVSPQNLMIAQDPGLNFDIPDRKEVFFAPQTRMELGEIAAFFHLSPGHIALWNGLDPDAYVQRGMVLRLFVPKDFDETSALLVPRNRITYVNAGTPGAQNALMHAQRERPSSVERIVHTISNGENLWTLAKKYGVSVDAIRAENGLEPDEGVVTGQKLVIPTDKSKAIKSQGKESKSGKGSKYTGDIKGSKGGHQSVKSRRKYVIQSGDSLWSIARKHNITLDALKRVNDWGANVKLVPGQTIRLP